MKVTVLGKSPSWQDAGGACSGYLVEHDGHTVLLDCGSGVFGELRKLEPYPEVDAVVISHLHADHFLDLFPYASAIAYGPSRRSHLPLLYVPEGGGGVLRRIAATWGSERLVEGSFRLSEYDGADRLAVGPVSLRFQEVPHYVVTYAVELSAGGRRLTFGADCSPSRELVDFAAGTDLLLIEATLAEAEAGGERGHLTAAEAGDHARRAQARRAVITHFSDELDETRLRHEAESAFGGPVDLARAGAGYELGSVVGPAQ